ncbi:hypothetical protein M5K25_026820 [Dendrobium thyrsiflorum]|uniref:Uncharacterized protein n=1 Tax=Dendrobium thyrsiflorum TaxID=117978 RepID=A0ABD0TY78_DENTH
MRLNTSGGGRNSTADVLDLREFSVEVLILKGEGQNFIAEVLILKGFSIELNCGCLVVVQWAVWWLISGLFCCFSVGCLAVLWVVGLLPSPLLLAIVGDPANDHGFVYNTKGQVDILQSPFFDFSPDVDHSVKEYVDRIIFQLAATIDVQLSSVQWLVDGNTKKSTNVMNLPIPTSSSGDEIFQVEESDVGKGESKQFTKS